MQFKHRVKYCFICVLLSLFLLWHICYFSIRVQLDAYKSVRSTNSVRFATTSARYSVTDNESYRRNTISREFNSLRRESEILDDQIGLQRLEDEQDQFLQDNVWTLYNMKEENVYDRKMTSPPSKHTCEVWRYDRANWTLVYSKKTVSTNHTCAFPYNETIKKIIKSNGDEVWRGCTSESQRCRESSHYDWLRDTRINTPPCCRAHIMEIMRNIVSLFKRNNITYVLAYGGVIGWYRHGHMIPYDVDLDLLVDIKHWRHPKLHQVFDVLRKKYGYSVVRQRERKLKIQFSTINTLSVDVWAYSTFTLNNKRKIYIDEASWVLQNERDIFPDQLVDFGGVPVYIPRNPIRFLDTLYGVGKWRTPLKCVEKHDGNCVT